ncbi:hypothetical protein [Humisphaera borealis]|uniref:Uncharacterized protein n=1 Tax=Humisphaera borealis TaxID=2807512 RepID=A0A7M2WQ43_9BACT|nr:hypothetical protein [Humisphaera borealis]QOV87645.1 hypothetical protein IPV69_15265 [Humisphaera borealis]
MDWTDSRDAGLATEVAELRGGCIVADRGEVALGDEGSRAAPLRSGPPGSRPPSKVALAAGDPGEPDNRRERRRRFFGDDAGDFAWSNWS